MKHKYALPLAALGIVLAPQPARDAAKDAFNYFRGSSNGIERAVQSPETNRLEGLLGAAYGQDRAEAKTYNPREEFRKLGWEVYDKDAKPENQFQFRTTKSEFVNSPYHRDLVSKLDGASQIFYQLVDGNSQNDELKFIFVTPDDYIAFSVQSSEPNIGRNGSYAVLKKVNKETADSFRRVSPFYK